jgi:N-acetylglucosaminyldiphosphoundecaprenol N-acetyl-beta-D-mannosaminyltransferase
MKDKFRAVRILGSEVHILQLSDTVNAMEAWIENPDGLCHQIVVTGFHGLWEGHKNPEFRAMLNSADLWVPDGIAPVWLARRQGIAEARRTPGAEITMAFLEMADKKRFSSFFYGDTDDVLAKLRANLEEKFPGHKIAGTYSPPFRPLTPREDDDVVQMINDAQPDVVWVGLGMPKQERWVYEHKERLNAPVAIGVGAAFAFLAGKVKRVPAWAGDRGLEWLWRLAMEPKKLWRRDLLDGPRFIAQVTLEMIGLKKYYYPAHEQTKDRLATL